MEIRLEHELLCLFTFHGANRVFIAWQPDLRLKWGLSHALSFLDAKEGRHVGPRRDDICSSSCTCLCTEQYTRSKPRYEVLHQRLLNPGRMAWRYSPHLEQCQFPYRTQLCSKLPGRQNLFHATIRTTNIFLPTGYAVEVSGAPTYVGRIVKRKTVFHTKPKRPC